MIDVKIYSLAGCDDTPPTFELVKNTAEEMSLEITLTHIVIASTEEAVKHKFPGSPTVRVNGNDIDASANETQHFGMT